MADQADAGVANPGEASQKGGSAAMAEVRAPATRDPRRPPPAARAETLVFVSASRARENEHGRDQKKAPPDGFVFPQSALLLRPPRLARPLG